MQGSLSDVTYFTTPYVHVSPTYPDMSLMLDYLHPIIKCRMLRLFAVCLSRFLLNLQSANLRALAGMGISEALTASHSSSMVFERIVGSLSTLIEPGDHPSRSEEGGPRGSSYSLEE